MTWRRYCGRAGSTLALVLALAGCGGGDGTGPDGQAADPGQTISTVTVAPTSSNPTSSGPVDTDDGPGSSTDGSTAASTSTSTATTTSQTVPPPEGLEELIPGHNDLAADRINLIFAPWGWDRSDRFRAVAELYVGWDQRAQLINADGYGVTGAERAESAELGLFGFEPFRSNRDKFNIWITDVSPPGPALWLNSDDVPFSLPDQSIVTLALDPDRQIPGISSVAGLDTAFSLQEVPVRNGTDSVANAMIFVRSGYPASAMLDLPHELGHALFAFADEYVGRLGIEEVGLPARVDIWPSCAATRATAERWWADLVGGYDPMIDVWADELTAAGFGYLASDVERYRELNTTAYIDDGCFGDPGSVRSTEDSLMGFNLPAFGLTNRRSAERILGLWEG